MDKNAPLPLIIDLATYRVWRGEREIELSNLEYGLVQNLAEQVGKVAAYEDLWRDFWQGGGSFGRCERNAVREAIKRLRRKLEVDPKQPNYLITVRSQ